MPTHTPVQGSLYLLPRTAVRGDEIIPLSWMRTRYPDLYELNARKYTDRPHTMNQPVEPLQCTWTDVVFLSPVHPADLFAALNRSPAGTDRSPADRPGRPPQPWTLDAAHLDPARTTIRLMRHGQTGHHSDPADEHDYLPFTTATLRAVSRVTVAAIQRLESLQPGDPRLPWVDVPHVLFRGSIPVEWFERPGQPAEPVAVQDAAASPT